MRNFRRIIAWQRSHQLALDDYRIVEGFGARHRFGLGDQMTRAAASIPANIAEGAGRDSVKEFRRFLTIALGSVAELENHFLFGSGLDLVDPRTSETYFREIGEIRRMLLRLQSNVRT